MSKFDRKKFEVGYQKDESSVKQSAGDMFNEFKAVSEQETKNRAKYELNTKNIPYEDIVPNPINRNANRDIDELADSILSLGLIHALRVKSDGHGKYVLTSGERRWRAIGKIREQHPELYRTVTCSVADADVDDLDEEARLIVANNDTCDPTPEEYRKSIERLCEIYEEKKRRGDNVPDGITKTIAKDLSMTQRQVQKMISINQKLIPELQSLFDKQGITIDKASNIAQLDPIFQEEILNLFNQKGSISDGEISFYRSEDNKLREENAEQKAELDRLRMQVAELKKQDPISDSSDGLTSEDINDERDRQMEAYENTIDELTKALKKSIKTSAKPLDSQADSGRHMLFQDTIARLERAQNNALRQAKGLELNEIEKRRLNDIIEKLRKLIPEEI